MEQEEREKWEYDVTMTPSRTAKEILDNIGDKGEGGWELVAVGGGGNYGLELFWKRKKLNS